MEAAAWTVRHRPLASEAVVAPSGGCQPAIREDATRIRVPDPVSEVAGFRSILVSEAPSFERGSHRGGSTPLHKPLIPPSYCLDARKDQRPRVPKRPKCCEVRLMRDCDTETRFLKHR